jgi:NhaC family Na+:H+ antiporter
VPAFAVGLLLYAFVSRGAADANATTLASAEALRQALATHFVFSPWLLLPPAVTLYLAAGHRPVLPGMLISVAIATLLAVLIQHTSVIQALNVTVTGYEPHTGTPAIDKLLAQGGMERMMHVTLIALIAFAFSGLLQKAGLLQPILGPVFKFVDTPRRLISATAVSCVVVELCTGAAFVTILLPTEIFAPAYRKLNLAAKNLTRTVGDCGIVGVPLLPWSIAGSFMSGALGVPVTSYAPWAVFCYAGIAMTLLAGFTGLTIAPRRNDDETQAGS